MSNSKRHIGIDILRICSMLMIVMMHLLKQGGILATTNGNNWKSYLLWLIEIICFCAVDCYALISGYVGVNSKFRLSKILVFWFQILFYTILITACFAFFLPDSVNLHIWWKAVFPILSGQYWYMTSYLGLLFFAPFLNLACAQIPFRQLRTLIGGMIVLFSLLPCILQGYPFNFSEGMDPFMLGQGYSMIWLVVLYLIGAYIRQTNFISKIQKRYAALIFIFSSLFTWGWSLLMPIFTLKRFGEVRYNTILLNYTSPAMLLMAGSLLILFAKTNPAKDIVAKIATPLASVSLSVYLIHAHPLIWEYCMKDCVVSFASFNTPLLILLLFLSTIGIYFTCTIIDALRQKIFTVLKIDILCRKLFDQT